MPAVNPVEWIARASVAEERGDLAVADTICKQLLLQGLGGAAAWNLIGRVALKVNRPAIAAHAFESALRAEPYFKPASKNLKAAQAALAANRPSLDASASCPRYHLILALGNGFWADVDHVLGQLLVAELTGRIPVIHWGKTSLYGDGAADAWRLYFEPVSPVTFDDLAEKGHSFFPAVWNEEKIRAGHKLKRGEPGARTLGVSFFERPETITVSEWYTAVPTMLDWLPAGHRLHGMGITTPTRPPVEAYRDLVTRFVRPLPDITAEVDAFESRHLRGHTSLAVHLRGSDKFTEVPELHEILSGYPEQIRRRLGDKPDARLVAITDSTPLLESFRADYGDRVLTPDGDRTDGVVGLHHLNRPDKRRLGVEVIRDVLIASRCDQFVGLGWSNVSNFTRYFKAWREEDWIALGRPGHAMHTHL